MHLALSDSLGMRGTLQVAFRHAQHPMALQVPPVAFAQPPGGLHSPWMGQVPGPQRQRDCSAAVIPSLLQVAFLQRSHGMKAQVACVFDEHSPLSTHWPPNMHLPGPHSHRPRVQEAFDQLRQRPVFGKHDE